MYIISVNCCNVSQVKNIIFTNVYATTIVILVHYIRDVFSVNLII